MVSSPRGASGVILGGNQEHNLPSSKTRRLQDPLRFPAPSLF